MMVFRFLRLIPAFVCLLHHTLYGTPFLIVAYGLLGIVVELAVCVYVHLCVCIYTC